MSVDASEHRCHNCLLAQRYCICNSRPVLRSKIDFCILMDAREPLKASNTGKLIIDCLAPTYVFLWSRTAPDPVLLETLSRSDYQPYLVFPGEYAGPSQPVVSELKSTLKRPLLIVLDGTWTQARKMLRKSPYLQKLPVLSLVEAGTSRYRLRRSSCGDHLCTMEVAQACLELAGEPDNARALSDYFDRFSKAFLDAREHR